MISQTVLRSRIRHPNVTDVSMYYSPPPESAVSPQKIALQGGVRGIATGPSVVGSGFVRHGESKAKSVAAAADTTRRLHWLMTLAS